MSDVDGAVRIVALGGLGEVGMNCLVLESDRRLVIIDCGLTFPVHEPGVDIIHADFSWLLDRSDDIEAGYVGAPFTDVEHQEEWEGWVDWARVD